MRQLPEQFLNSLEGLPGYDREAFTNAHEPESRITSIRLNPFKKADLDFPLSEKIPWSPNGYYLEERPYFTYDPLFHAGCYYVQEPGSMFLETALVQVLDLDQPLKVLDACAAPGGKSTLVNSLLNGESLLVANEVVKPRSGVLSLNLARWGTCNTIVTNSETERFTPLENHFDTLIVDAPCSGSGLFRKQPEAIAEWSPESVVACSIRQKKILEDLLPSLKPGGHLIYCTCSYSAEENEEIVSWLISESGMEYRALRVDPAWGVIDSGKGYRFYPHLMESEGFFLAVLVKPMLAGSGKRSRRRELPKPGRQESEMIQNFVNIGNNLILQREGNRFHLLSPAAAEFLSNFEKDFYFRKAGTAIGEIKGRDLVPDHELALSLNIAGSLKTLELTRENAISFLRKEEVRAQEAETGLTLVTYKGKGLGWVKVLSNRINNYLPSELRILK